MTVMGEAIGKWGSVVEDVFIIFRSRIDGILESVVFSPPIKDGTFDSREVSSVRHSWVRGVI